MSDERILAELEHLRAEIGHLRRPHVVHYAWAGRFVKDFETDPHLQYKIHRWGMYFWLFNFFACSVLFFFSPGVWLKWGLYITLMWSIYANFSTDFGAMSAAMAAYDVKQDGDASER